LAKKKKAKVSVINRALVARKISVERFYARNRERERERTRASSLSLPSTLLVAPAGRLSEEEDGRRRETSREASLSLFVSLTRKDERKPTDTHKKRKKNLKP
jgi:hypothetical protein